MHSVTILLLLGVLMGIVSAAIVPTEQKSAAACGQLSIVCTKPEDCCSGCCTNKVCSSCTHSPCTFHHCPEKKVCYLEKVTCIQAPCDPIPACKPEDSDYDDYPGK